MYLLNATEVNEANSTQQQGSYTTGAGNISRYASILSKVTTRLEGCLEVASLSRQTTVDYFEITGRRNDVLPRVLRLSGRFLSTDPVEILFTNDLERSIDGSLDVDHELGVVYADLAPGRYKLTYVSGFTADNEGVFEDTPEWLKSIAKACLELQYRLTTKVEKTPDNVSYGDLLPAVKREMFTLVTHRAEKPRVSAWFPTRSVHSAAPVIVPPVDPDDEEA